jgi:hypothetical protein
LKHDRIRREAALCGSRPARGAWIETEYYVIDHVEKPAEN